MNICRILNGGRLTTLNPGKISKMGEYFSLLSGLEVSSCKGGGGLLNT